MSEQDTKPGRSGLWGLFGKRGAAAPPKPAPPPLAFEDLFGKLAIPTATVAAPPKPPPPKPPPPEPPAPAASPGRAPVSPAAFTVPQELARTPPAAVKTLSIGSCLLEDLMRSARADLQGDVLVVNGILHFPAAPPRDIAQYDLQIVQIPMRAMIRDVCFNHLAYDDEAGMAAAFADASGQVRQHLECRLQWNRAHGILTFVMNFMEPQFPMTGRLLPRFDLRDAGTFVRRLNEEIEAVAAEHTNVHVLDLDRLAASFGRRWLQDDSLTALNHNAMLTPGYHLRGRMEEPGPLVDTYDLSPGAGFRAAIFAEIRAMYDVVRQTDSVKLVVLDLDDTLWEGVSGDRDDAGPQMVEGWPLGIIEALHHLRKRGVLLAIASKNDAARIREIWPRIFGARLRLDDFAAVQINWQPKPDNMRAILQATNLLPSNVLFVDDNPVERAQMEAAFPGLRTIGGNPYVIRRVLLLAPQLQVARITAESAARTRMMQAQITRESERASVGQEDFARGQAIRVAAFAIGETNDPHVPRCLELINKTNQFNTTGRRWTAEELRALLARGGLLVAYQVEDRFTPYGLWAW